MGLLTLFMWCGIAALWVGGVYYWNKQEAERKFLKELEDYHKRVGL